MRGDVINVGVVMIKIKSDWKYFKGVVGFIDVDDD